MQIMHFIFLIFKLNIFQLGFLALSAINQKHTEQCATPITSKS